MSAAAAFAAPGWSAPSVVNGLHAAFHGVPYTASPPPPPATYRRFFFSGESTDQLNKLAGAPSASFNQAEPTGAATATQTGSPLTGLLSSPAPTDRFTIFWSGPFTGTVNGPVQFRWYWASANPTQLTSASATVDVSLWADPKPDGTATLIGTKSLDVPIAPVPEFSEALVPADGTVAHTLIVQVVPHYVDTGEDLRVNYGSATAPSGFGIPAGATPAKRPKAVNVDVPYSGERLELQSHFIGRDSQEPTIGVKRDGVVFMAAGVFPFVGNPNVAEAGIRPDIVRSTDGGATWKSVQPKLPAGAAEDAPASLDPYVYVDTTTGRVFTTELYSACTYLHYSDNNGDTWNDVTMACGSLLNDHQTIVAGPPPPGVTTTGYPNVVYYCVNADGQDAECARSLDGGNTWKPTANVAFDGVDDAAGGVCGGLHGHIVTDKEGRLYLPKGHCDHAWLGVSADGGDTWKRYKVSDKVTAADIQTSVAVDRDDNLYYVWWDGADHLPYLAVSRDHGATWSTPRMIAPPGVHEVTWPSVDVGDPGHIVVSFPGATADPPPGSDFRAWNHYVVVSANALDPDPLFLSATSNDPADPVHRGPCQSRCEGMWDFLDNVVSPAGEAWATMVDDCTPPVDGDPVNCVTKSKPSSSDDDVTGTRLSAPGYAVQQVAGPRLRVLGANSGRTSTVAPATIPATGGRGWPPLVAGVTVVVLALGFLRRRAHEHA